MDEAPSPQLVSEFAAITGASPLVAEHYLSACNNDLNRAVEFFFEHPPAPTQSGPGQRGEGGDAAAAFYEERGMEADDTDFGPAARGVASGPAADEDEELQRALAASMTNAEPGAAPSGRHAAGIAGARRAGSGPGARGVQAARQAEHDVQVLGDEDDEELEGPEGMLSDMARLRERALRAEREAQDYMEETIARSGLLGGLPGRPPGTVNPPPGYPGMALPGVGVPPSMFPGMGIPPGLFPPGMLPPGFPGGLFGGEVGPSGRAGDAGARGRSGSDGAAPGGVAQRRRVEARRGGGAGGEGAAAAAAGGGERGVPPPEGTGEDTWTDDHEALGMSRAELEEARMMEAAMLGIPYEGPPPGLAPRGGGGGGFGSGGFGGRGGSADREVAPELLEHRELRWDQDRAYEESLAADRAKEQAAARAKAEAEARERAQREAEEEAALAAAMESSRLSALLAAKTARLPAEPPAAAPGAVTVMVRLPDGSRHSRRFAATDRLSSLFDFVDVQLDSNAKAAAAAATGGEQPAGQGQGQDEARSSLKPGSYNLVAQYPRRVFNEVEHGVQTFGEAGLAGGGGAAFFVEQIAG